MVTLIGCCRGARPPGRLLLLWAALFSALSPALAEEVPLILESVEIHGNTRTSEATLFHYLPVRPGDRVTPKSLVAAVETLRSSGLFQEVEFSSRRGGGRGRIVLLLQVREKGVEFRFGAGYRDLSGWYLIPAELRFDNRLGRGESARLHVKVGYRLVGLVLSFDEQRFGDGKNHWGFSLSSTSSDRAYFLAGIEYRHKVQRGEFEVHIGRDITPRLEWEIGAGIEQVDPDSFATAHSESEVRGVERGDELDREGLPPEIAADLGEEARSVVRFDLTWDSRGSRRVAGSPIDGIWGRLRVKGYLGGEKGFPAATADLRGYWGLLNMSLAGRLRAGAVGGKAPFYDRFYVGGLYTVRGFPSQSLSAPGGETKFWSASLELRAPLIGRAESPRLAGVLFLEAGDGWDEPGPALDDVAVSTGYGLRLRVPWFGWLGLDVGIPLTDSPVKEAFHVHASIGWTF